MFFRGLLLPLGAVLLSGLVGAPSSSGAQDALFVRTQAEIERLWSGVLGCADGGGSFTIRNRFNGFDSTYGASVPAGGSSDYSQCGKRALRNTSSRILVDTIEDAVRSGGVSLFDSNFRLDSSISWIWGENVTGDLDAVVPLLLADDKHRGSGHALFLQPGLVFWTGLEEQERLDGNLGIVYRFRFSDNFVAGGSVFYDYDAKNENRRVGAGLDLQSYAVHAALNYYHPLNEWQEGRPDYEEQPLQGGDFRLGLAFQRAWLDASVGVWRFEGEDDEEEEWRRSFGVDAGIRIFPGVFLKGGYEQHDEDDSFGTRWNTGLAFRFALPGLDGAGSFNNPPVPVPNLFEPVAREKRILYEERLGIPEVRLSATVARVGEPEAGEGQTVTFTAELGEALEEDVALNVMVAETSTATLGEDFTYGHRVYERNGETGEQSAPAGDAVPCPDNRSEACVVPVPASVTRFDIEVEILTTDEREIPEFIDFLIEVPEEYASLLRGSGTARVTIEGHGNEIAFATDAATMLDENNETTGIQVSVGIDRPSPVPITLDIATSGTATEGREGDYTISTRSLTIPANASSASVTLRGIDNERGEGSKSIVLTISGNDLPEGWEITDGEHRLTLRDDDLSIYFTSATPDRVAEPDSGSETVTVMVGITQAPSDDITVGVTAGGTAEQGSGKDYTFTAQDITFSPSDHADKPFTFDILADDDPDPAETVILTLADRGTQAAREADGFSLGNPHTITIPANDNTVGFASTASTLAENNETTGVEVSVSVNVPSPEPITLNIAPSGTAREGRDRDYTISTRSLTIPANASSASVTLRGIDNERAEGSKDIILTLSGSLPEGWAFGTQTTHTVTLSDDDMSIYFTSATPGRVAEPVSGNETVTVVVGITQAPTDDITVRVAAGGTAEEGSGKDYTFTAQDITFSSSDHADKTFTFDIHADDDPDPDETIILTLADRGTQAAREADNFSLGADHTIIIPANDNTVGFTSAASTLTEGNGTTAAVTVNVNRPAPVPITLNVAVAGTATEGRNGDYTISTRSLTIGANQQSGTITLTSRDEGVTEAPESIELTISAAGSLPSGWTLGTDRHDVRLIDTTFTAPASENSITFIEPFLTSIAESNGTTSIVTRIDRQLPAGASATVTVTPTSSSLVRGTDYSLSVSGGTLVGNTWTLPTETSEPTLTVTALSDIPANATVTLTFAGDTLPDGWGVAGDLSHEITITDSATPARPIVGFVEAASTVDEPANGVRWNQYDFQVRVSQAPVATFFLNVKFSGSATALSDYSALAPIVFLPTDPLTKNTWVRIHVDDEPEEEETIIVTLSDDYVHPMGTNVGLTDNGNNFEISRAVHTVTIRANDNIVGFASSASTLTEGNGTTAQVTVNVNRPAPVPITLNVAVAGTATEGRNGDYTISTRSLTIGANQPSGTITLTSRDEGVSEPPESIELTISASGSLPDGWMLGTAMHQVSLIDTTHAGEIVGIGSPNAATLEEVADGTNPAFVDVPVVISNSAALALTLTNDITLAHTLSISADENDDPGDDVVFTDVIIDAATGEGSARIEVSRDTFPEEEEVVTVTIMAGETSLPDGWTIDGNNNTYTLTIPANDNTITFIEPFLTNIAESSGTTSITTRIDRQLPAGATATVTITPTSDSLVRDTDYSLSVSGGSLTGNTWTLPTGVSEPTLTVTALSDISANATLTLAFAGDTLPDGWKVAGDLSHEITITDSATPARPIVGFVEAAGTVDEPYLESRISGAYAVGHNVQIRASEAPITNFFLKVTGSGTATRNIDYSFSDHVEFTPSGSLTQSLEVRIFSDNQLSGEMREEPEEEETITITLSDDYAHPTLPNVGLTDRGNNFVLSRAVYTVTIRANDNIVGFADEYSIINEGSSTQVGININRPFPAGTTASVQVNIRNNGTTVAGDYTITGDNYSNGVLTLPIASDTPNDTATLTVAAIDGAIEVGEGITLTLVERGNSFPLGWEIGNTRHSIRFFDSASKTIGFATPVVGDTFNPARIFEENPETGLQHGLTVRVESAPRAPSGGFDIEWKVKSNEGEESDADQLDAADRNGGTISFSEGDWYKEFEIMIEEDATPEGATPVTLMLSTPAGASLPPGWGFGVQEYTFTIESSDSHVEFSSSTASMITASEGDTLTFEVEIGSPVVVAPSTGLVLHVTFAEGNAAAGKDLRFEESIMIPAGQSKQSYTVEVIDDGIAEGTEVYNLTFGPGEGWPVGWGTALGRRTITINPSDPAAIGFTQTASSAFEGDDDHKIEFDLGSSYSVPDAGFLFENLGVAGALGDATYNSNVLEDGLDITILPGENTGDKPYFTVSITADGTVETPEDAETITFTLPDPLGEAFSVGTNTSHTLTIEPSNNAAFFSDPDFFTSGAGVADNMGTVAENGTSVDVAITLFEFGAPSSGLPLKLQLIDMTGNPIEVNTTSPVSLSSDLDNPTNEVEFVVPAGVKRHVVPVYVRDNSTPGGNDPAYIRIAKGDNFPDGWGDVNLDFNRYTLTIVDDDENNIVSFSSTEGTVSESSSGTPTATTNIMIDPVPTEEVVIPVTFSGNAASYEITSDPSDALTRADGAATGTVTFAANRGSVELTLTAQDDDNAVTDIIKVEIDDDDTGFPDGYSSAGAWTVEVADKGPNTIGWFGYGIAFPATVGGGFAAMPPQTIELEELTVDITETWPPDQNSDVPVFVVLKDGDGNIYARDEQNRPGTTPHDTRYQTAGSINPPIAYYVGITGSAYGNADRYNADNDGDGIRDEEDGQFHVFNPGNTLGGTRIPIRIRDTITARPDNGAIRSNGINRLYIDDNVPEYAENLILTLEEREGGMLPEGWEFEEGRTVMTFNIAPSDNTVTFSNPLLGIHEDGGSTSIVATIDNPILAGKTASITITTGGTAIRDTDYTLSVTGGSLSGNRWTLPTGQSSATLNITAIQDENAESPDETIELTLADDTFPPSLPPGWTATETTHTITIAENPQWSVNFETATSTATEGTGDAGAVFKHLFIRPKITENVTIPLIIEGDADAYQADIIFPSSIAFSDMITFTPSRENHSSEDYAHVLIYILPSDDNDTDDDDIKLTIDVDNLPEGYRLGTTIPSWTVTITDAGP